MARMVRPVCRPSVEVEFETRAKPQLLQGEEFLMQRLAGWDMIQSFNNVWRKKKQEKKGTFSFHKQAASP